MTTFPNYEKQIIFRVAKVEVSLNKIALNLSLHKYIALK